MECEGDASGSSRLKLRRTNRYANCDIGREVIYSYYFKF